MSKYYKYIKYKTKYALLQADLLEQPYSIETEDETILFKYITIKKNMTLYHGSHFKINDSPFAPSYFSQDIMQSVGHILIDFRKIKIMIENSDHLAIKNKLDSISNCYPLLYEFTILSDLKLLKIQLPHRFEKSFDILFNLDILTKYILLLSSIDKNEIMNIFLSKLKSINILKNKYESIHDYNEETIQDIITAYKLRCEVECFGGWTNTPGYYLLSKINYNDYLKELGILKLYEKIDGLYIENDQDEIVMFNLEKIKQKKINFILPYSLHLGPIDVHEKFIERYIYNLKNRTVLDNYNNILKQIFFFNIISRGVEWNFDYFQTPCFKYNPYIPIEHTCAKDIGCKYRKSTLTEDYSWTESELECVWKSHKISLHNMQNINYFKYYVKFIKRCSFQFYYLLERCEDVIGIEEITRKQFTN